MNPWLIRRVTFPLHQLRRGQVILPWYRRFLEMERWEPGRLREWQEERLKVLLSHAHRNAPYYRDCLRLARIDLQGTPLWEQWERVPMLSRAVVRGRFKELLATDRVRRFTTVQTSGSMGVPTAWRIDWEADDIHRAVKFRDRHWWGFRIGDRQVWLWGRDEFQGLRKALGDTLVWNKRLLPVLELSGKTVRQIYKQLLHWRPRFLYGYPSGFMQLARLCEEAGLPLRRVGAAGVITTAEILSASHRHYLREAFQCPIINEYGCAEVQAIAFECPEGSMHIHADALFVEFIRDDKPVPPGEYGEVVVTDFFNEAMPLIRYRTGDIGRARSGACPCGRTLPRMELSVGRELEMLRLPDGRLLHPEVFTPPHGDPLFHWVERFRIIHESPRRLRVQVVTAPDRLEDVRRRFIGLIHREIGDGFSVDVEGVSDIPRDPSGKLRYFVSQVKPSGERV